MIRTQIQLPDELYDSAKKLSSRLEISLAELVRRGLEYVIATAPGLSRDDTGWSLPEPGKLGGHDPFENDQWRLELHTSRLNVAESEQRYGNGDTDA